MTKMIQLAPGLKLPVSVVTQRKTVVAKNRVGKSNTGCVYVEKVHALDLGIQTVVLDPKGDWWGIKSSSDGKATGLPFTVFGGDHADVPIEAGSGKRVAEYLANNNVSVIIDLSEFDPRDICRFAADFLQTIYKLWRKNRTPLNLVLEEADDFAPQMVEKWIGPEQARCLSSVIRIAKKAGFLGIGLLCITQRCASLSKNVLTQSDMLVFMRTVSPQDIKAADEWLKNQDKAKREEVLANISSLQNGEAYVFHPELGIFQRVQLPRRETYDSGYTPKVGEKRIEPKVMAKVDIERLRKEFSELIDKAKADDPAALKAQVRELQKKLAALEKAKPVEKVEQKVVEVSALLPEDRQSLIAVCSALDLETRNANLHIRDRQNILDRAENVMERLENVIKTAAARNGATKPVAQVRVVGGPGLLLKKAPVRRVAHIEAPSEPRADGVTPVQQKILDEMAELAAVGIEEPERAQLAFFCGYTNYKSGGFSGPLGNLVESGHVATPRPGCVSLSAEGAKVAKRIETPRTTQEYQERLLGKMDGPRAKILAKLIELHPQAIERSELGQMLGYTNYKSGGFSGPLGSLVALGMAETPQTGFVRASDRLFLD